MHAAPPQKEQKRERTNKEELQKKKKGVGKNRHGPNHEVSSIFTQDFSTEPVDIVRKESLCVCVGGVLICL